MLPFEKISGPETKDYSPISLSIWLQSIPGNQSTKDIKETAWVNYPNRYSYLNLSYNQKFQHFPTCFSPLDHLLEIVILKKNNIFGPPSPPWILKRRIHHSSIVHKKTFKAFSFNISWNTVPLDISLREDLIFKKKAVSSLSCFARYEKNNYLFFMKYLNL